MKKKVFIKAMVIVGVLNMLNVFLLFSILKINNQEFWTQVGMVVGTALVSGLIMMLIFQLIGMNEPKK